MKKNKKVLIIGCAVLVVLLCLVVGYFVLKKNSNDSSSKVTINVFNEGSLNDYQTITLEYSNEDVDPLTYLKEKTNATVSPSSVSLKNIGNTQVTYTINEEIIECTFIVQDTQAPVITLNSDSLELDSFDGFDLNSNIQSVDDPVEGTFAKFDVEPTILTDSTDGKVYETGWYTVTLQDTTVVVRACDNHGNTTEKSYVITLKPEETSTPEPTETPDTSKQTMYSYEAVDLSGIDNNSNWSEVSTSDWYYSACSYRSGHYNSVQEAIQDVVDHEAAKGNTVNVENATRIFCVRDGAGNVLYYQAGYEE